MHPAKAARLNKEKRPELYCPDQRCLWRLSSGNCPKHMRDRSNGEAVEERTKSVPPSAPLTIEAKSSEITVSRDALNPRLSPILYCLRCHVNEPLSNSMLCAACRADAIKESA